jgi:hypothetical protein
VLQLQQDLPEQISVANLSGEVIEGRHFKSFGFRKNQMFNGLYSRSGTIDLEV